MAYAEERLGGRHYNGLKNQGSTCYLNCVLQCLYMTEDFRSDVENFRRDPKNTDEESADLMEELQKLFKKLNEVVGTTEGITRCLHISNIHEQQDAVEYYQKTLKLIGPQMSKIFQGEMSNKTKCQHNHTFQEMCPFFTVPLSIDAESSEVFNVNKGLESFSKKVKLDEDNMIYCDECGQKAEAYTWTEIEVFPTILTLYLKRFHFDYNQMKLVKNNCPIEIPWQLQRSNFEYELYAVINHIGGRSGGHYNAVIRSFRDNKWYCFDDSYVAQVPEQYLEEYLHRSNQAYLLMYKKVDVSHPDKKSSKPTYELQQHWQEYCEWVTKLLQCIRSHISVFEERKFLASYEDIKVYLCHLLNTELLQKEAEKKAWTEIYKNFESAVQAGQISLPPGYHPTNVENEWNRLCAAIQNCLDRNKCEW